MLARRSASAFSLLEILAALAVMSLLFLLAMPAYHQMATGARVTIGSRAVIDELNLAQQTALSRNAPVEVRLYKLPGLGQAANSTTAEYRAIQVFLCENPTPKPFGKAVVLPSGLCIVEDPSKSSLFATTDGPLIEPAEKPGDLPLPSYGTDYKYRSFRFRSNGETDMTGAPAFLTLAFRNDKAGKSGLPSNFVTIQIDPVSGRARTFRP